MEQLKAQVPQLLSQCSRAHKPQLLSPCAVTTEAHMPRAHALQQEKLLQLESSPYSLQLENRPRSNKDPAESKTINKKEKVHAL